MRPRQVTSEMKGHREKVGRNEILMNSYMYMGGSVIQNEKRMGWIEIDWDKIILNRYVQE